MPVRLISSVRGMGVADMREHVDVRAQLLDGLLVLDAEALLLVDHQQAEVLELDALDQQPVGADDAVDLARLQPGHHGLGLSGAEEAGQHLDADRVAPEAVGEGVAVLLGEERGGHQDRDLLAGLDGLERGADRHLGLAEADVAAQQAVHREAGLHVVLHVADGVELVGRLDEGEALLQLVLPGRVVAEGEAGSVAPPLVQHDQLLGDLPHGGPDPALGLLEVRAAEAVERGRLAADVVADGVDLVGRDVELVAALVLEQQVVALDAADRPLDHAAVAADPVVVVDDVVAGLQVLEDARRLAAARPGGAVGAAAAGQVGLGQHGQPRLGEDGRVVQRRHDDPAARSGEPLVDRLWPLLSGLVGPSVLLAPGVERQVQPVVAEDP